MLHILDVSSPSDRVASTGGAKAAGLQALQRSGERVPPWSVLGTDIFAEFVDRAHLAELIAGLDSAPEAALAEIRSRILAAPLGPELSRLLAAAHERAGGGRVAVRSSGLDEDGDADSYAGQFSTVLNVTTGLESAVRVCWASAFSDQLASYRLARGRSVSAAGIAVVVQAMVAADISGVVFSADPITGDRRRLLVSTVYGLGEGLVEGLVDADLLVIDRARRLVLETVVGEKANRRDAADGDGITTSTVPDADRVVAALDGTTADRIVETALRQERRLGRPVDIEFAVADGNLWVLQCRPITALPPAPLLGAKERTEPGARRIWDNSNIIESFNGVTSPLTATTAAEVYGRVYLEYARSLRVPPAQLRQMSRWTPAMLGIFHGRVYYNLLHWYRMVGIAPGYPLNRRVLEVALGVGEPLAAAEARRLHPFVFRSPVHRLVSRTVTTVVYARRLAGIDRMMERFTQDFARAYDDFDRDDLDSVAGDELYRRYRAAVDDLVKRWGPMMVLDAILLTLSGAMYALTKAWLPRAPEWLMYAVVNPGLNVESAEPALAMRELARSVRDDPELADFLAATPPAEAYEALARSRWTAFARAVDQYIGRFGYRSVDELKLEVPDLREEPASLFLMLRSATADAPLTAGPDADVYLDEHLRGIRRTLYERLRRKTSRAVGHRETLRFRRTRAFGMVKRTLRALGRDLVARGVIDEFADVFLLTVDELRDAYEGAPNGPSYRHLVAARRAAQSRDALLVAPARFVTSGDDFGAPALAEQGWVPVAATKAATLGAVLVGVPSAAGIVRGTAVVVTEPADIAGGILVAYRTDPGWVAILPSARALVIERGSPLTHLAIVARELGVPTVVQLPDASTLIRTGMQIEVDGAAGTVTILDDEREQA
ncbi:phosphoenolpyruvate synthase [Microbacterium sp. DT81.1]|uniref:phosphoenolpyruvate synthase n=1 Tax=Microbacterium sp. DT81.1 TaxID=3393413 RepID=UPI003CEBB5A2